MTGTQLFITVAIIAVGTALTRFLPFILFRADKPTPKFIKYLGRVLPPAVFGMLVIYCLKGISFVSESHGLPELIAVAVTAVLQLWQKKTLLSIAAGTICYMLLIQFVF